MTIRPHPSPTSDSPEDPTVSIPPTPPTDHTTATAAGLDTTSPRPARRYNAWLGGKDNFAADRGSAGLIADAHPTIAESAQQNRRFLLRAVRFLVGQAGIQQIVDIGVGLPMPENVHTVAQSLDPATRVVYIDNDPMVMTHARALLTGTLQGRTAYIEEDLRHPHRILTHPDLKSTVDLSRPVGLLLGAVMHFVRDQDDPHRIVAELIAGLAPGSYLVLSHADRDFLTPHTVAALADATRGESFQLRDTATIQKFFAGLEVLAPGIGPVADWRPDPRDTRPHPDPHAVAVTGGVARKPTTSLCT